MEFLIMVDILFIFLLKQQIYSQDRFQKQSTNQLDFFENRVFYFCNKLLNQIKNGNSAKKKKKIILDGFRKKW